jgi:hypothetical protein
MTEQRRHLVLVWDADRVQRGIAAWRRRNYRLMVERDERKRAERRAKRARGGQHANR